MKGLIWTKTPEELDAEQNRMYQARAQLGKMAESGIGITCCCGHVDDAVRFTRTEIFGDLPPGQFQCPACGLAIERQNGRPTVYPSGFVTPGQVTLVQIGRRM